MVFFFTFYFSFLPFDDFGFVYLHYIELILRQSYYYIRDFCSLFPKLKMLNNSGATRVRREQNKRSLSLFELSIRRTSTE